MCNTEDFNTYNNINSYIFRTVVLRIGKFISISTMLIYLKLIIRKRQFKISLEKLKLI